MKTSVFASAGGAIALSCAMAFTPASGSGLSLDNESSAVAIGDAHSGTAGVSDASTIVGNPAGLAYLPGIHFTANLTGIDYAPKFTNTGSTSAVGSPATGGNGGNAGGLTLLPSLFFSAQLAPSVTAGVGVYTPFGLKVQYDSDWVGRYQTVKSDLETININPSVAWKATDQVSLAGGIDIMQATADLTRNIDFGSVCFGEVGPATCTGAGVTPQNKDGTVELQGSSWGVGYNLGALFQPTDKLRFGLTYRSAIREDVQGSATYANPALPGLLEGLTLTPATQNSRFTSTVWLPESVNASFLAKVTSQLTLLGNVNWTRWSRLNQLDARFNNGAPDSITTFNWRNTWNLSLGLHYQLTEALKLRTGVEYETDASRYGQRNPLVPESTRRLIAIGANYAFTPRDSVDLGYSHVFFGDFSVNSTATAAGTLNGTYKVSADLFALQYNHSF